MKQLINRLFGKRKENKYLKCYYGVSLDKKGNVLDFKTMPDGRVFALVCDDNTGLVNICPIHLIVIVDL